MSKLLVIVLLAINFIALGEALLRVPITRVRAPLKTKTRWPLSAKSFEENRALAATKMLNETDYIDNFYVAQIQIGTPPQITSLVFDTGSANLWVMDVSCPCGSHNCNYTSNHCNMTCPTVGCCDPAGFNGCNNPSDPFVTPFPPKYLYDPSKSSTYNCTGEEIQIFYGLGNCKGLSATETIEVGGITVEEQGFFSAFTTAFIFSYQPMSGIFGLGYPQLAEGNILPPVNKMIADGLLDEPIFSVWMEDASVGATGGEIIFGGMDQSKIVGPLNYVSVTDKGYWQYKLDKIEFAGKVFNQANGYNVISDTGTSYIIGDADVVAQIAKELGATNQQGSYSIDCAVSNSPAHVDFTIAGKTYQVYAKDLVIQINGQCILAMQGGSVGLGLDFILGDSFMRNVYHVFDFGQDRIGMAETNIPDCLPTPGTPTNPPAPTPSSKGGASGSTPSGGGSTPAPSQVPEATTKGAISQSAMAIVPVLLIIAVFYSN
jgi:hypothetical protein